jgi:beta-phosphoglucomutase family hydrolase
MSNNRALIWDMDGIIADTSAYHFKAWQEAFQKRGVKYTIVDFQHNTGMRNDDIVRTMMGNNLSPEEIKAAVQDKDRLFLSQVTKSVSLFPGVRDLVISSKKTGFKQAVASSAPLDNIKFILDKLSVIDLFDTIVTGWEVKQSKPNPEIFLRAAEKLGIAPQYCIVIEDAIVGVAACKNAGMKCLAVTNTNPEENLHKADLIVDTLEKVSVVDLNKLLGLKD